jgi:FlaA1/EpsC-like NDP-sugar epimerase
MIYRLTTWFFGIPRAWKRVISIACDYVFLLLSFWVAYILRYDRFYVLDDLQVSLAALVAAVTVFIFIRIGLYRAVLRFMGTQAMSTVLQGVTASTILLVIGGFMSNADVPRSVPFIYWSLAMVFTGGSRMATRAAYTMLTTKTDLRERVLIYGAGSSGCQLATALQFGREYMPVAFVDDDQAKIKTVVKGLRVYSPVEIGQLIRASGATRLLLAISNTSHLQRNLMLRFLEDFPIKVQTIPGMADLVGGRAAITEFRDLEIEDLLGRDAVPSDQELLLGANKNRVVMVTGAGGSIGSELCRQIVRNGAHKLVMLDVCEYALYEIDKELQGWVQANNAGVEVIPIIGSVQKEHRMEVIMRSFGVEVVYHAAAYKHVPLVEQNIVEGVRNNVFGTWYSAEAAVRAGVESFVLVSTDKAVRPTNAMGASKRFAELVLQAMAARNTGTRFTMVRFGNVLGSSGSVVPLFRQQIREGGPVTVTHPDIIRYFMTIAEAASLVMQAGEMGEGGEVFLLDMGAPVKIADLAAKMIRLMGHTVKSDENPDGIEISFTGLRPGEKLYEELLVGQDSEKTRHARIMKAREASLDWQTTKALLLALDKACHHFDCSGVRDILLKAPLAYNPEGACADLVWTESGQVQMFTDRESVSRRLAV